jgi:hypothetical protein
LKIGHLINGGIMVNYRCNAACRHCLYACSPTQRSGYITKEKIAEICRLLVNGGIGSVHIGGGEPFLDFQGLLTVIRALAKAGIRLDYIETNAFWAHDPCCAEYLEALKKENVEALCISVDPFHAEYVPWAYPLELARACDKQGMGYFLWKQDFIRALSRLDANASHTRPEIETALSPEYVKKTASAYGIRLGGRATNIEEEYNNRKPLKSLMDDNEPCKGLLSTGHFHVDMDAYFIPPGCTGLRLPLNELLTGLELTSYPAFGALYTGGIAALFELADRHGFTPDDNGYVSKCNLCFHIRNYLASMNFQELDKDHYKEALKYY